jgi:hypothetical protein
MSRIADISCFGVGRKNSFFGVKDWNTPWKKGPGTRKLPIQKFYHNFFETRYPKRSKNVS